LKDCAVGSANAQSGDGAALSAEWFHTDRNIWTVGLDERGTQSYDEIDYNMDCAIVLGNEGKGVHDLVARKCDFLVSIPMLGKVPSLNVSVAAGVVLYEIVRQRRIKAAKAK